MRNALRSLGIVVVLMGTNMHVVNMINQAPVSRTAEEIQCWCYVWEKLPRLSLDFLAQKFKGVPESIMQVAKSSRPLFAVRFLEIYSKLISTPMTELERVDESLKDLFTRYMSAKFSNFGKFHVASREGQCLLLMNSAYVLEHDLDQV